MKIKVKNIKIPKCFPYKDYTCKVENFKFEAHIYEDNGGQLIGKISKDTIVNKSSASLDDWIDEIKNLYFFYGSCFYFLKEVKYLNEQEKK
jgi:hypothetical protein